VAVLCIDCGLNIVSNLGDSQANHVAPRFHKLLEDAKWQEKPFPMVLFRTRDGTPPLSRSLKTYFIRQTGHNLYGQVRKAVTMDPIQNAAIDTLTTLVNIKLGKMLIA
jgi:hypothetical protein